MRNRKRSSSRAARAAAVACVPLLAAGALVVAAGSAFAGAPYSCTTSSFSGACPSSGSYSDPNIWGSSTYGGSVRNQIWSPVSGETSTMSANSLTDWQDVINVPAGNTSVTGWPDSQVTYTQGNDTPMSMSGITSLTSTLDLNMQSVSGAAYDNGWDIWGGVTGNSSTDYQYEMMIWTNQANRGTCGGATVIGTHTFGSQDFTLCWYGSDTGEFVWYLSDASGNPVNETNSSVDIYSMLQWMITNGYYPSNYGLNQITVGSEVCSTGGNDQDITLTGWTITENGSGGGGQLTPSVGTNAATGVTSSGATLNGTVNPQGADTHYQFDYSTTANYGSSTASTDAGSGTSDENESASVTGLQPNTTYHYRMEATNSAGTNYGNDQTFTTPAAAGGVSYDSQGSGKAANASSLTWTQTVSGSSPAVLAEVSVGNNPDTGLSASLKDNGAAMTLLKTVHADNASAGFIDVFGLTSAPTGTNTFTATVSGGTATDITGGSESFDGAGSFGVPASAYGVGTTPIVTDASGTNGIVGGFVATGTYITDASSGASRFIVEGSPNDGAGNSAGSTIGDSGGNVTLGWDVQSDYWAAIAVDVQAGSGGSQQAPAVTTNAATSVTSTGATLNGSVNPEGADASYKFDYGTSTSYGSSTTSGDAGSGSSAVNESATLTGLAPSTIYHYRIESTNSGGTSYGSDQTFTTSASGGSGQVTFDAASKAKATALSLSWTHTVGPGSDMALLVQGTVGVNGDSNCSQTMTDNGNAMTKLAIVHTDNQTAGFTDVWGIANPPAGANTIKLQMSGACSGGTPTLTAGAISFSGVSQSAPFGTAVTAYGSGSAASVALSTASSSDLVGAFVADGSGGESAQSPLTSRYVQDANSNSGAGNSAAATAPATGSSVTSKWNIYTDYWAAVAVEVQHD